MSKIDDMIGCRYGRLIVVERAPDVQVKHGMRARIKCICDCGNTLVCNPYNVLNGHTSSCGCYRTEIQLKIHETHGQTGSHAHQKWLSIRKRCYSPQHRYYKDYGGRGIKMCDEWYNSFEAFKTWLDSQGYEENTKLSIDRIDNNEGYNPDNCRLATSKVQCRNRRSTIMMTYDGITKSLCDWADEIGVSRHMLYNRRKKGWSDEEVINDLKKIKDGA